MIHYPIKSDSRYTVQREFCGHAQPRFVLRFCTDFIASFTNYPAAVIRAAGEKAVRNGAAVIVERKA